eukprot:TRINITY_DN310_c1_g1_i2.p1 TRINITY_DN310_c1_g1~~TRINITY_DN310_c1_g1_i2.p1  ORF type:complete len:978 (+),score=36.60 TRINITY_DN310_c1_g1_i2:1926-4859(+)
MATPETGRLLKNCIRGNAPHPEATGASVAILPTTSLLNRLYSSVTKIGPNSNLEIEINNTQKELTILGANVCSISGKSQVSYDRRKKLSEIILSLQPEIIILVETNLEDEWNPFPNLYDSFRTNDNKAGGILILTKKGLNSFKLCTWENHGLMVNCISASLFIIGMYTPYRKTLNASKEILDAWTKKGRWLVFADNESWILEESERGKFKFIPDWSRQRNGKTYITDGFYGNIEIRGEGLELISDHRILQCKTSYCTKLRLQEKATWSRNRIIYWATEQTKFRSELLQFWPQTPLINLIKKWIKPKNVSRVIWMTHGRSNLNNIPYKQWRNAQRIKLSKKIDSFVGKNSLESLANSMRKLLKLAKPPPFPIGVTTEDGEVITGEEATKIYACFYRKLYKKETRSNTLCESIHNNFIEIDADQVRRRLSQGKAMALDMCPDELVQDDQTFAKLLYWAKAIINGLPIPKLYKTGRLLLLSKTKSRTPKVEETRPITILSIVLKCLEAIWAIRYEHLIWSSIGHWQVGFRKGHSTQEQISKLKLWLMNHRNSGIVIFVDVRKAFDTIERSQIFEALEEAGVDQEGIKFYSNLVDDLTLSFNNEQIAYERGVPQGSLLSPMLFNLVYEKILKEAHERRWEIFAYADDLAICVTAQRQYLEVVNWLGTWKRKAFLEIKKEKTKEIRLGRQKNKQHAFEVVSCFKYLGVMIYDGSWTKLAKKRCREIITTNLVLRAPWMNYGATRLATFWWLIASVLYQLVSEVVIGNLDAAYIENACLKAIRKAIKTPNFVPTELLKEFYQLKIASTLERMSDKIRMNLNIQGCVRPKEHNRAAHIWIQALKISRISPSQLTTWARTSIWRKGRLLLCKICKEPLTVLHAAEHIETSDMTKRFIQGLAKNGINLTIADLSLKAESIKTIIEEGKKLLDKVSDLELKSDDDELKDLGWTIAELDELLDEDQKKLNNCQRPALRSQKCQGLLID